MLVARQYETDQGRWSSKFDPVGSRTTNFRMSTYDGLSSLQSGWNGHILPNTEDCAFSQACKQAPETANDDTTSRLQTINTSSSRPDVALPRPAEGAVLDSQPSNNLTVHAQNLVGQRVQEPKAKLELSSDNQSRAASGMVETLGPAAGYPQTLAAQASTSTNAYEQDCPRGLKDEDDLDDDDDDMLDVEGEGSGRPMTAAERTAARRKMKRFRLTHQQTRFLMSEFAKQPHPDAAHRERLSREIPGLSPRQVQVWFQNRRAKIKRLTADDRDRMIKMRAVPDDFDNVQALHSPYGAVHGLGTPMASPNAYMPSPYGDHTIMRPVMGDTIRRPEGEPGLSSAPMGSGIGGLTGFSTSTPLQNTDMPSPLSTSPNDRHYFSNHLASPVTSGQRSSNFYDRHGSEGHLQASPQSIRPLQPLHLRDTMARSRADSLQSPLRSSMSWKGDSIDYSAFPGGPGSPGGANRHQSLYQSEHYETSSYPSSSTNINYSSVPPPSLQPPQQNRSTRLRAATASLPLGLDLRNQYRPMSLTQSLQVPHSASAQRPNSTTPYSSSSSFPSAPLTAPVDYTQPRTPGIRPPGHDAYSMPQMSAPIAAPSDFGHSIQTGGTGMAATTRTPMRDSFSGMSQMSGNQSPSGRAEDYARTQI